jgi:hypothetical protein
MSRVRFPVDEGNCYFSLRVQKDSGAHPASYPLGTEVSYPGGKAAGGGGVKLVPTLELYGAIPPLPHTSPWHGA